VELWDRSFFSLEEPTKGLAEGKLDFLPAGTRWKGGFIQVNLRRSQGKDRLLFCKNDGYAGPQWTPF
jgi:hypothetical protein